MTERRACPDPIRSHAHAIEKLADAPYLAYALVQGFKLTISLLTKRWPDIR